MRRNLFIAGAAFSLGLGTSLAHESKTATAAPATPAAARMTTAPAAATPPAHAQAVMKTARAVLDGVGVESAVQKTRADLAVDALGARVRKQSEPGALRMAFAAYYNYKSANPRDVKKPYLYYVDYGLDSRTPRGYVFDMENLKVVDGPFMVAHGRGSAPPSSGVPVRFSNRQGSNSTSLGLYLAQETYGFSGKAGGRRYTSVGLRMKGLSGRFNSAARSRGVVAHGAPYVTPTRAGRSEGCPAMEQARARKLLPQIANGGLVFLFSPLDEGWKEQDPWANRSNG